MVAHEDRDGEQRSLNLLLLTQRALSSDLQAMVLALSIKVVPFLHVTVICEADTGGVGRRQSRTLHEKHFCGLKGKRSILKGDRSI